MPQFKVTAPDGSIIPVNAPEGATEQQAIEFAAKAWKPAEDHPSESGTLRNIGLGMVKGASEIGATILTPVDAAARALGIENDYIGRTDRRAAVDEAMKSFGADTGSLAYGGGKLAAEIAGTAGVGGALAKGAMALGRAAPVVGQYAPKLAAALESGGFNLGTAPAASTVGKVADWATRIGAGATVGGASAGLINPEDATIGSAIGGSIPGAAKLAGAAGNAIAKPVTAEVHALYQKAKDLGIEIPADRLINSRPVNAVASSLNYVPLSGRSATEEKMLSQMNRAVSRTFGQDSDNVTAALRKASADLGDKFGLTLNNNSVKVDNQFLQELADHVTKAGSELGPSEAKIIGNQVDLILSKAGQNGEIEGQAAYNIKKALDRIGNRNTNEAYYARDLKRSLMGALDRSLGPQQSSEFATLRKQYGNMLELENLAQNGAEGGISVGRIANLKNINNPELQDIADIAAQFLKTRENPHGAAQRIVLGGLGLAGAGATGTLPALAGGVAAGRATNMALNSETLKRLLLTHPDLAQVGESPTLRALLYQGATGNSP